jgi:hypothetical protein
MGLVGKRIRFGKVAIMCELRPGSLIAVYWKLIALSLLVILVFAAIAGGITAALFAGTPSRGAVAILSGQLPMWSFALYAVAYLLLMITFWVLMRIYTLQRVWRRVLAACAVIDIADASDVAATGDIVSAFGEGLADGLDFGL